MYVLYFYASEKLDYTKEDKILDLLYTGKAGYPTENLISNAKNKAKFSKILTKEYLNKLKKRISSIRNKIPLYDIYSKDVYLINAKNVYDRVMNDHYRFTDKKLFDELIKLLEKIDPETKNKNMILLKKKLEKNIKFLKNFDLTVLENAYVNSFYYESNKVGKNLTTCIKKSFLPYLKNIKPYYSRSELINMGLNMGLIKPDQTYYTIEKIEKLCSKVRKNDIGADILLLHQKYIEKNNGKYVVQFYSVYGSYYMNKYLRNLSGTETKNPALEKHIKKMWNLIVNAPPLDKEYIIYRFIEDDGYLAHLKIGDKFITKGFISCTRDPFYNLEDSHFGFILIKITIPKSNKGTALCLETYSHFTHEQELILPPKSIFKLDGKDRDFIYYHTNEKAKDLITKKYEFTYMGHEELELESLNYPLEVIETVDFMNIELYGDDLKEKIVNFLSNYVNKRKQFKININNKEYTFNCNWYDSTDAYSEFFYIRTKHGFYIYHQNDEDGRISMTIEVHNSLIVNYYLRFDDTDTEFLDDESIVRFVSEIAYAFKINDVIIHSNYGPCTDFKDNKIDYESDIHKINRNSADLANYSIDFYQYLTNGTKRFDKKLDVIPNFKYHQLDKLEKTSPNIILRDDDRDDLHKIYKTIYSNKKTLKDFYLFIQENFFYKMNILEQKMSRLYSKESNPFAQKHYTWKPYSYLYNNELIGSIPTEISSFVDEEAVYGEEYKEIHENKYRKFSREIRD